MADLYDISESSEVHERVFWDDLAGPGCHSTPVKNSTVRSIVVTGIEIFDDSTTENEGSCVRSIDIFDDSITTENEASRGTGSIDIFDEESIDESIAENETSHVSIEIFNDSILTDLSSASSHQKSVEHVDACINKDASDNFELQTYEDDGHLNCTANACVKSTSSTQYAGHSDMREGRVQPSQADSNHSVRDDDSILWLLSMSCCTSKCLRKLSVEDIEISSGHFKRMSHSEQRNYVLGYMSGHSKIDDTEKYITEFIIKGKSVCREAWLLAHNIKKESYRRLFNRFKEGSRVVEHGNKGLKKPLQKTKECIAWLKFFITCVGQYQPDNTTIHLPSCFTILSIYRRMVEENDSFGLPSVGISHFYNIFHTHFPRVLIPKENRFTKCTDCTRYKEAKEKTLDKRAREQIDVLLKEHIDLVWRERRVYYLHRYKARRYPDKYLTVIDDGMDQKTTCIPRVRRKTKATCNLTTLGTHLVGGIFHSGQSPSGKDIFGSFDYYQWKHDPNLTASVLLSMLTRWCEMYKLPPVLYLQLDNCVKENKNQYMMWLLALLLELKVFDKVKLNFLPVGHTHEDIDAVFGVFSKYFAQTDVYVIEDLLKAMSSCLTTIKTFPYLLDVVYNIKEWLLPHAEELHEHTHPKCFKFTRDESGHCIMFYRNYSHMKWEGPQRLLKTVPTDKPDLVQPTLVKIDIDGLKRDSKKFKDHYPAGVAESWQQWLGDVGKLTELPATWEWPIDKLQACDKVRPTVNDVTVPAQLQTLHEKETQETRQIYTGRYQTVQQRENPVESVDNWLDSLEVGEFVAVRLANWDKEPVLGKVLEVYPCMENFKLHYWKGSYKGKWSPQNVPRQQIPWVDDLPKACILLRSFSLTENNKLVPSTRKHLKDAYSKLKEINQ